MSWGNTKQPCGPHLEIRVQSRIHLSVFSSTLHPLTLSLISISNIHQIYNIIRAHCPLCRFLFPLLCYGYRYEGLPLLLLRLLPLGPDQLLLNPTTGFLPNELSCWHEYCISWSLRRQCMLLIIIKYCCTCLDISLIPSIPIARKFSRLARRLGASWSHWMFFRHRLYSHQTHPEDA